MRYYPDVHKYFMTLYNMNQDWFKVRSKLTEKELQILFQLFLRMDDDILKIKKVLYPNK